MKILYIYRNHNIAFSIGKVFKPIENEMKRYADVQSIELPEASYGLKALWKNIRFARNAVRNGGYDVVHITGSEHYLIPFLKGLGAKVVVTVHDLGSIYQNNNGWLRQRVKTLLFVDTLKHANRVTFISEKSRQEASQYTSLPTKVVDVIPDAVDSTYVRSEKNFNTECPRILHIGTKPIKNLERVCHALKGIKCHLRIIGKLKEEYHILLNECGINYSNSFGLTDEEIHDEYKKCDIVSFASVYEGFGMPIIEGQSVGRVVVTSNISPMKEVAGGGAVLVDPFDVASIKIGFEEAIVNHEKYVSIGLENVKHYTVVAIAKMYFDVYKKCME